MQKDDVWLNGLIQPGQIEIMIGCLNEQAPMLLWVCLVYFAKFCKDVNMVFEVLNKVYLQNFLHR